MRYLLDTDTVVDVIRKRRSVALRLSTVSPEDVAISAMTLSELEYGAIASSNPAVRMTDTALFLERVSVLPFDADAAREHAKLRLATRHSPIGQADLVIAATAAATSRVLVSSNLREFARVPGLEVESWR